MQVPVNFSFSNKSELSRVRKHFVLLRMVSRISGDLGIDVSEIAHNVYTLSVIVQFIIDFIILNTNQMKPPFDWYLSVYWTLYFELLLYCLKWQLIINITAQLFLICYVLMMKALLCVQVLKGHQWLLLSFYAPFKAEESLSGTLIMPSPW